METLVKEKKKTASRKPKKEKKIIPDYDGQKMTLLEYWEWQPEDETYKYEWVNGILVKKIPFMKNTELFMVSKLLRLLSRTKLYSEGAELFPEYKCKLNETQVRIPDLAFFTRKQIIEASNNEHPIPEFVIEIISTYDRLIDVELKVIEYFRAGVKLVWHIIPQLKMVRIFHSLKNINTCTDDDTCSAAPIIDDFAISVNELFSKNEL
jgi:Uma2 family endonuclease